MSEKVFERKKKESKPVVAICYDFDKTLSPDNMQAQGFLQAVGYEDEKRFWTESNDLAEENNMDQNLAYMFKMKSVSRGKRIFTKQTLMEHGATVKLFPGVEKWFERIRNYGKNHGVIIEHYIISSGLKEMIEGTSVAKADAFEKIYASSFYYDDDGVAVWPAQVINYTNKTQFLFRIEKGVLDINDMAVNKYFSPDEIRVPFRNMVYIGDSDTDIPCMKLVNANGGHSIGVYNPDTQDKTKVLEIMHDNRIKYFAMADYSENSELDKLVKMIIDKTVTNEKLEELHYKQLNESNEYAMSQACKVETTRKDSVISSLESSYSFTSTHTVIAELNKYDAFNKTQANDLCKIAIENSQVNWILEDEDIKNFYMKVFKFCGNTKYVRELKAKYKVK